MSEGSRNPITIKFEGTFEGSTYTREEDLYFGDGHWTYPPPDEYVTESGSRTTIKDSFENSAWYKYITDNEYIRDNELMSSEDVASYIETGMGGLQILKKLLEKLEEIHGWADKKWSKAMNDLKQGKSQGLTDHARQLLEKKNTRWRTECHNIKSIKLEVEDLIEQEEYKQLSRDS